MVATDPWNSLEIAKLVGGLITPAVLAGLGIYIHRVTKRFEHMQWRTQKLIEKRLAVYDDLAPHFNDLLCYFTYVGCWKELSPMEVVSLKRKMDKKIYLAAPLFSYEFQKTCENFQNLCFETYGDWGTDARLKTDFSRRQQAQALEWMPEWNECFSDNVTDAVVIRTAYAEVMRRFSIDIGVHQSNTLELS